MSIRVLFFASLADIAGTRETSVDAHACPDVASVFAVLSGKYPGLGAHRSSTLCSLNWEYAKPDAPVKDGDEVAFFPPVSGG
jgi:molybdopterin converting factor subunit 1